MPRFEEKEIKPAREAVVKQVMVIQVDKAMNDLFERDSKVSNTNRWGYLLVLVLLWFIFGYYDVFGVNTAHCAQYHHGDCIDGDDKGFLELLTLFCPILITFFSMLPATYASQSRKEMREVILTSLGWDGKAEYRLEVR